MSSSTNTGKYLFSQHQIPPREFEAGSREKPSGPPDPRRIESRDCVISFHHTPCDRVEPTELNSWKGSWHWDIRTDTTFWSEQLYWIIGRENATIPPFKEHACFHTPGSWIRLVDATSELFQTGAPYELKLQMLHASGARRWVIRNGEAVRNARGDIIELRGTVQDISERVPQAGKAEPDWQTPSNATDDISRLIQAQENENCKLAIDLRDNTCQRLSLLAAEIQSFSSTLSDLSPQARTRLEQFWQETAGIQAELDRVSDRLYPRVLDLLGLPQAMRRLCRECTRELGIPVEYSCSDVPAHRLDKQCRIILYRVLEEILANVVRHSRADHVTVRLDHGSAELRLRVSDNGIGFDQEEANTAAGFGFARIKAQIGQIGGSLAVWSKHACGTLIEARTPLSIQPILTCHR